MRSDFLCEHRNESSSCTTQSEVNRRLSAVFIYSILPHALNVCNVMSHSIHCWRRQRSWLPFVLVFAAFLFLPLLPSLSFVFVAQPVAAVAFAVKDVREDLTFTVLPSPSSSRSLFMDKNKESTKGELRSEWEAADTHRHIHWGIKINGLLILSAGLNHRLLSLLQPSFFFFLFFPFNFSFSFRLLPLLFFVLLLAASLRCSALLHSSSLTAASAVDRIEQGKKKRRDREHRTQWESNERQKQIVLIPFHFLWRIILFAVSFFLFFSLFASLILSCPCSLSSRFGTHCVSLSLSLYPNGTYVCSCLCLHRNSYCVISAFPLFDSRRLVDCVDWIWEPVTCVSLHLIPIVSPASGEQPDCSLCVTSFPFTLFSPSLWFIPCFWFHDTTDDYRISLSQNLRTSDLLPCSVSANNRLRTIWSEIGTEWVHGSGAFHQLLDWHLFDKWFRFLFIFHFSPGSCFLFHNDSNTGKQCRQSISFRIWGISAHIISIWSVHVHPWSSSSMNRAKKNSVFLNKQGIGQQNGTRAGPHANRCGGAVHVHVPIQLARSLYTPTLAVSTRYSLCTEISCCLQHRTFRNWSSEEKEVTKW